MEALLSLIVPAVASAVIQGARKVFDKIPTTYLPYIIMLGAAGMNAIASAVGLDLPLVEGNASAIAAAGDGFVGGLLTIGFYHVAKRIPILNTFFGSA